MKLIDEELSISAKAILTPLTPIIEKLVRKHKLKEANITCWLPHEVASIVQIGVEDGIEVDFLSFLGDVLPPRKYMAHDEPGTPYRYNSFEHFRTKLMGNVSMTFIVKGGKLYIGKWQGLFLYSPVFMHKPDYKLMCRILKFK